MTTRSSEIRDGGFGLAIGPIVVDHASFAHRSDFMTLPTTSRVEVSLDIEVTLLDGVETPPPGGGAGRPVAGITLRVATQASDPEPLYRFDVAMTAMVAADAQRPAMPPMAFVAQSGVSTLFPFVRELVANLTARGRFGPIWLRPINVREVTAGLAQGLAAGSVTEQPGPARKKTGQKRTAKR